MRESQSHLKSSKVTDPMPEASWPLAGGRAQRHHRNTSRKRRIPRGCQHALPMLASAHGFGWHPYGVQRVLRCFRRCRYAQPPANRGDASGIGSVAFNDLGHQGLLRSPSLRGVFHWGFLRIPKILFSFYPPKTAKNPCTELPFPYLGVSRGSRKPRG